MLPVGTRVVVLEPSPFSGLVAIVHAHDGESMILASPRGLPIGYWDPNEVTDDIYQHPPMDGTRVAGAYEHLESEFAKWTAKFPKGMRVKCNYEDLIGVVYQCRPQNGGFLLKFPGSDRAGGFGWNEFQPYMSRFELLTEEEPNGS